MLLLLFKMVFVVNTFYELSQRYYALVVSIPWTMDAARVFVKLIVHVNYHVFVVCRLVVKVRLVEFKLLALIFTWHFLWRIN